MSFHSLLTTQSQSSPLTKHLDGPRIVAVVLGCSSHTGVSSSVYSSDKFGFNELSDAIKRP